MYASQERLFICFHRLLQFCSPSSIQIRLVYYTSYNNTSEVRVLPYQVLFIRTLLRDNNLI